MIKTYVASPLGARYPEMVEANRVACKLYIDRIENFHHSLAPVALHHILPRVLDDSDPADRELALEMGREVLKRCDALLICGNVISKGMAKEIEQAMSKRLVIYYANESLLEAPEWSALGLDGYNGGCFLIPDPVLAAPSLVLGGFGE